MPDRRVFPWIGALIAVAVACAIVAIVLGANSAAMFHEVDEWNRSQTGTVVHPDEIYLHYDTLMATSYTLQSVLAPLMSGVVLALLALLAVLAVRWERREAGR